MRFEIKMAQNEKKMKKMEEKVMSLKLRGVKTILCF